MRAIKESKRFKSEKAELKEKEIVESIISKIKEEGNKALREFTYKFDGVKIENFKVSEKEKAQKKK